MAEGDVLIRKLELFGPLPDADKRLLDGVTARTRSVEARTDLIREGGVPDHVYLVLEGLACRYKILWDGRRSIFAYLVPGDFADLHVFILKAMDHSIATLSPCTVVDIHRKDVLALSDRPTIARALWWASLVDSATLREWLVNVGRRDAETSIAHLFCEIHLRMASVGLAVAGEFDLPITQSDLADTNGLSAVHVNRSLSVLRDKGLVTLTKGRIVIANVARLRARCQFNPNYLHLGALNSHVRS